jgi:hypothetical protein
VSRSAPLTLLNADRALEDAASGINHARSRNCAVDPGLDPGPNLRKAKARAPGSQWDPVFTISDAAAYVGVSPKSLRRWSDAGHVSCFRSLEGQRSFTQDQLDEFITSIGPQGGPRLPSIVHAVRDDPGPAAPCFTFRARSLGELGLAGLPEVLTEARKAP